MKTFVISLKRAADRRIHIDAMMKKLSVNFEYFDAVDAKEEPSSWEHIFSKYSEERRIQLRGTPLLRSEIACFASHYVLWNKCVDLNETLIILEDDCVLNDNFFEVTNLIGQSLSALPSALIRLHHLRENPKTCKIANLNNSYTLQRYTTMAGGTTAYILSPIVAKKLINNSEYFTDTVDDYLDREGLHQVDMVGVSPKLVTHLEEMESTIGDRSKKIDIPLRNKIRREIIRLGYDTKTLINRIKFLFLLPSIKKKINKLLCQNRN